MAKKKLKLKSINKMKESLKKETQEKKVKKNTKEK